MTFQLWPAIDLMNGKPVRLVQGDFYQKTEYNLDIGTLTGNLSEFATGIHVVDLDGARSGDVENFSAVKTILHSSSIPVQVGGGIRTFESINRYLSAGVSRVVLGSAAIKNPVFLEQALESFGEERIVLALDLKDGKIATEGWEQITQQQGKAFLAQTSVKYVVLTDIKKDGLLQGPNQKLYKTFVREFPEKQFLASGGVACQKDLEALEATGVTGAIIGKALYEKKLTMQDLVPCCRKRIIPCLDIKNGRVVKGTSFKNLQDAGDGIRLAQYYSDQGADELIFLDISATEENRKTVIDFAAKVAEKINIPFTIGGGVSSVKDAEQLFRVGADKIALNSAAVKNPSLIRELADRFGSQAVVVAVDVKRKGNTWEVFSEGGKTKENLDGLSWIAQAQDLGAGEILLTSIDEDGQRSGFDRELYRAVQKFLKIPLIASGGAGKKEDFLNLFQESLAEGALAASVFHFGDIMIPELKIYLAQRNVPVRLDLKNLFEKKNLLPVIIQDVRDQQVLMLGYMNQEALEKTLQKKRVTFYSRQKKRLWTKGETSGNFLKVQDIQIDCDQDALLVRVFPAGPTCHTGKTSCFGEQNTPLGFLGNLRRTIRARREKGKVEESYVAQLFEEGLDRMAQKVGEEAIETILAAKNESKQRFISESADLLFHWFVLCEAKETSLEEVIEELSSRR